jgi:hypothetical protein
MHTHIYFIILHFITILNRLIFRYYYNKETGVTQWERPAEMGPAPLATGIYLINSFLLVY